MSTVANWTAREAVALQTALLMSNQRYASHVHVSLRTVNNWHGDPTIVPKLQIQSTLQQTLDAATPEAKKRFADLTGWPVPAGSAGTVDVRDVPGLGSVAAGVPLAPADVAAARGLHNLPAPRNQVFVDRDEDMAQLDTLLGRQTPATVPVLHGLGGTGKTALALEFAHRAKDRLNPVWWISAASPVSVTTGLAALAAKLNPHEDMAAKTSAEAAEWALSWLQAHDDWLLVLDDADSPGSIETVLGTLAAGRHLVTSRRATGWHRVARPLPLTLLPPDAALDLLLQFVSPGDESDRALLQRLAEELGYLPLALEQAAAYIQNRAVSPAGYLDRLQRYPARMFAASADPDDAEEGDRQRTVARIWQVSMQDIAAEEPLAGTILLTFAWYGSDPIPRDLAYALDDDPIAVDDALALLNTFSMITLTPQAVTIHRLVQAVARLPDPASPSRTAEAVSAARDRAAETLLAMLPENPLFDVATWPRWRELLPHALALTDHVGPDQDTPATAAILVAASAYLQGDGHFDQAIATAQRAVDACGRLQGPDTADTLIARSFLASAYRAAGDLAAAAPLHTLNVNDSERALGPDHPQTLDARANLAYLLALQHEEDHALELHERNLAAYERVYGPDHPHTLNARANLASSHRATGHLDRAIELHQQSLDDYARVLGGDHSETVTARSNLAYAYQLAGNLDQAIPLHRQVLADRERLYGEGHRYTEIARQLLAHALHQASEREPTSDSDDVPVIRLRKQAKE